MWLQCRYNHIAYINSQLPINYNVCCTDTVSNSSDEFRDLFEIYLGLYFAVGDLLDIKHDLDHSYPHDNNSGTIKH